MSARRLLLVWTAVLLGCESGPEHLLLIEIASPGPLDTLAVTVEVAGTEPRSQELAFGGTMPTAAEPARVAVSLPSPASVRVYAIGRGVGGTAVAVRCYEVSDVVRDTVLLTGGLPDDADGDGYTVSGNLTCLDATGAPCAQHACASFEGDCDDASTLVHPLQTEMCGADLDCDRTPGPCPDADSDGFFACPSPDLPQLESCDCDDGSDVIEPGATDPCGDAIDQDCDGADAPCDGDGDGSPSTLDCDDADPTRAPTLPEVCTMGLDPRVDEDCDGSFDEGGCTPSDRDGDGAMPGVDCDDCDPTAFPGAVERCGDGVDQDCDGADPTCPPSDADGDGAPASGAGGTDCDDDDPLSRPGGSERCGGLDEDCDGRTDESCPAADADGDGWVEAGDQASCEGDPLRTPGVVETCDGVDGDCDGRVDEDLDPALGCIGVPPTRMSVVYASDLLHCGSCDGPMADCAGLTGAGDFCMDGDCGCSTSGGGRSPGPVCSAGETCCEDGCRDTQSSLDACGACDRECNPAGLPEPVADTCVVGVCHCGVGPACTVAGTGCCAGSGGELECMSLASDPGACGACGVRCGTGETCVRGECACGSERRAGGPVCTGHDVCCPPGSCRNENSC